VPFGTASIEPSGTYTVPEVAMMLDQSGATIRRLVLRGKIHRAPGLAAVRITHSSIVALLSLASDEPVDLSREFAAFGRCLVMGPNEIASLYRIHPQTAYRMLSRGVLPCVPWLWSRRVLKSAVTRALGSETHQIINLQHSRSSFPGMTSTGYRRNSPSPVELRGE